MWFSGAPCRRIAGATGDARGLDSGVSVCMALAACWRRGDELVTTEMPVTESVHRLSCSLPMRAREGPPQPALRDARSLVGRLAVGR